MAREKRIKKFGNLMRLSVKESQSFSILMDFVMLKRTY